MKTAAQLGGGYPGGNTAEGQNALLSLTTGTYNAAVGILSLRSDTSGSYNTALGAGALVLNNADQNTATGFGALLSNSTGAYNTANGALALFSNTEASRNTAIGSNALFSNITGEFNTAIGESALTRNTQGEGNIATGGSALSSNTEGNYNTATGYRALLRNTTGTLNMANGKDALYNNTQGQDNTATGFSALFNNTVGDFNTANGSTALYNNTGDYNTAIGHGAGASLTTGSGNVCIGALVAGAASESNTTRIRNIGVTPQDTQIYVTLDANGGNKLGYVNLSSSRRFKEDIEPMAGSSEALFTLNPVKFRYKPEINPDCAERFGLLAEEVEEINPDLVSHDSEGKPIAVRYESVNAMLLNEFLKEHRKAQEMQATIAQLKENFQMASAEQQKQIQALMAMVKEQAAQIQKVSAQVEMSGAESDALAENP
jgi:hypothetical protein